MIRTLLLLSSALLCPLARPSAQDQQERGPVARALAYIVSCQDRETGQFRESQAGRKAAPPSAAAVHALAMLALQAEGSTMRKGPHKDALKRAVLWLRSRGRQDKGRFCNTGLGQALACQALNELAGLSAYKLLMKDVRVGTAALLAWQNEDGGFPAGAEGGPSEIFTGVHAMLAMDVAQQLCKVDTEAAQGRLRAWFGGLHKARSPELMDLVSGKRVTQTKAAGLLFARRFAGADPRKDEHLIERIRTIQLVETAGGGDPLPANRYLVAHAAWQIRGALVKAWALKGGKPLVASQLREGAQKGAFPLPRAKGKGGQLWNTCLSTLALQAEYRFGFVQPR